MYQEKIQQLKKDLENTVQYLKNELAVLQAGRATPSLLENLEVDCYNQRFALKQLAAIQCPEPRVLIVRPWDKSSIPDIEKAIRQSNLGVSPITEEDFIRVSIPPLSEERRKELTKILQDKTEEVRISVRRQRGEVWDAIQAMEKSKDITEDQKFKAKDELQKVVDKTNEKIEGMSKAKAKELMAV